MNYAIIVTACGFLWAGMLLTGAQVATAKQRISGQKVLKEAEKEIQKVQQDRKAKVVFVLDDEGDIWVLASDALCTKEGCPGLENQGRTDIPGVKWSQVKTTVPHPSKPDDDPCYNLNGKQVCW